MYNYMYLHNMYNYMYEQHPSAFAFSSRLLEHLADEAYVGRHVAMSCNSEKQREILIARASLNLGTLHTGVCAWERERVLWVWVWVWVWVLEGRREREREEKCARVCVCERERERQKEVWMCCVLNRERQRVLWMKCVGVWKREIVWKK